MVLHSLCSSKESADRGSHNIKIGLIWESYPRFDFLRKVKKTNRISSFVVIQKENK